MSKQIISFSVKKKSLILLFIIISALNYLFSEDINYDPVVDAIINAIKTDYNNLENRSFNERLVMEAGRRSFMLALDVWRAHYAHIYSINIEPSGHVKYMCDTAIIFLPADESGRFVSNLKELTFLAYRNLDLYYRAIRSLNPPVASSGISVRTIDLALLNERFYNEKIALYDRERVIKREIEDTLLMDQLKFRLAFYLIAFRFFNNIREDIINRDIENMNRNRLLR